MSCKGVAVLSNCPTMLGKSTSDHDSILNENVTDLRTKCTCSYDNVCVQEYRIGFITEKFLN
jgi:hypothetical protein